MPSICAAVGCSNMVGKALCTGKKISFHGFPLTENKTLKEWVVKLKRQGFKPNANSRLCSEHFEETDFIYQHFTNRRGLKPGAVPSKFAYMKTSQKRQRTSYQFRTSISCNTDVVEENEPQLSVSTQTEECTISALLAKLVMTEAYTRNLEEANSDLKYGFENARKDAIRFESITGFSPEIFDVVFAFLDLKDVNKRSISPKEQFFIFLIRIRSGVTLDFLSSIYNTPKSTLSRIITDMTHFIYAKLKSVDIWPSKDQVKEYMPEAFISKFPDSRVIIDCTEIFIHKPSNPKLQQLTWSSYKNTNTLKALIGITPSGAVSFISDLWCGGVSDKELFKQSGLLDLLEPGDTVLLDRGFTVQDLLNQKNCNMAQPHFLANLIQFSVQQRSENKQVSHLRVHVERAISRIKKYRYFNGPIRQNCFKEVNKIFYIVTWFTLFMKPLITIK